MPRRTPADRAEVMAVYERTGSGLKTATELGLHRNTVYGIIRRERGDCLRCRRKAAPGKRYCETCLPALASRKSEWRAERRRLGLCYECDERVDGPVSRTLCREHRIHAIDRDRSKRSRKRERGGPLSRRIANIRRLYGDSGVAVWERDGAACVVCASGFGHAPIEIHHVDLDETNHDAGNMVCLCRDCHRVIHGILKALAHPQAAIVVAWAAAMYPGVSELRHLLTPTGRTA